MKTRTTLAAATIVVIGGLGTAAGVASAQRDPAPPATSTPATPSTEEAGAKARFVCANLDQIQRVQADHATSIDDRLTLLASAKAAAQDAGRTTLVARIDARTARLTERRQKVTARQQHLAGFAAAHCDS